MAGSSLMETLFQRSLDDLIKGLRLQLIGESAFISNSMDEIRREIKSTDLHTKSTALQKLSYLSSVHGVDMSWAAFHVVEVMSSSRFAQKRIGYFSASQSFHETTPVLLLITNQLRKDLTSSNEFEVSLALECLSVIGTVDLARDLTPEIFTLLSSSKVLVRKKAIGVLLKIFEKYPDAVRVCFKRLVENLDSSDPLIVSAVVGVFCELASHDPRSYLPLAPEFYRILVNSKNNWLLIKVLKIFSLLAPLEPRLAKRIVEPICDHMRRTGAKSLMFECIRTVVTSLSDYDSAMKLAVGKIRELLSDDDPNLKYLGLHALFIIVPEHLWAVLESKDVIIKSLSDVDPNIKLESLRLVMAMVSDNNVVEISRVLVNLALRSDPEFCNEILCSILDTCSRNVYEIIVDFDWYVSLLGEMARIPHCQKGEEIEKQLIDVGLRVKDVRPELVRVCRDLLIDPVLLGNPFLHRILSASAWDLGEYVEFSRKPSEVIDALLQPRTSLLPPSVRAVYIQSAFKVLVFCLHSYVFLGESTISAPSCDNLAVGTSKVELERECAEASCSEACGTLSTWDHDKEFNLRVSNQSLENLSTRASLVNNDFTLESIVNLLKLIESAMGPLSWSHDVEVVERSRNLLSFIGLIRQKLPDCLVQKEGAENNEVPEVSKIVELISDCISMELGPVSISAQERVPLPNGLELKENLDELDSISGVVQPPSLSSFSQDGSYSNDIQQGVSSLQNQEESETSSESTYLLTEHRKRHGLYYLPSEKNEILQESYPSANDPKFQDDPNASAAAELVKLAEQTLALKKKPNHAKPRPVVVRLDEGEELPPTSTKKQMMKDDLLSGAVSDVLSVSGIDKSSSRIKGKEKVGIDHSSQLKDNLDDAEKHDFPNPSSRGRKERLHRKGRSHRSKEKDGEEREQNDQKGKHISNSNRHGRHKGRQRADMPLAVASQAPVIPDFLL